MITWSTAPKKPVIKAIGLGTFLGVTVPGAKCQKLYMNLAASVLLFQVTDSIGAAKLRFPLLPYPDSAAGATLWVQGAWEDSKTRQLGLTLAWHETLPQKPKPSRKKVIWSNIGTSGPNNGPSTEAVLQSLPFLSIR